jgi:hypothetical protein
MTPAFLACLSVHAPNSHRISPKLSMTTTKTYLNTFKTYEHTIYSTCLESLPLPLSLPLAYSSKSFQNNRQIAANWSMNTSTIPYVNNIYMYEPHPQTIHTVRSNNKHIHSPPNSRQIAAKKKPQIFPWPLPCHMYMDSYYYHTLRASTTATALLKQ